MIGFSIKKPFLDNQIARKINSKSISRTQGIGGYRREYVRKKWNSICMKWERQGTTLQINGIDREGERGTTHTAIMERDQFGNIVGICCSKENTESRKEAEIVALVIAIYIAKAARVKNLILENDNVNASQCLKEDNVHYSTQVSQVILGARNLLKEFDGIEFN